MDATKKENPVENISKKNADDLLTLAKEDGYDSIRFFIAPDKKVSADSIVQDVRSYFIAKNDNNKGIKEVFSV